MFETQLADQVFTLSSLPLLALALGATLGWLGPLLLWGAAWRAEHRGCLPGLGAGVLGLFAAMLLGAGGTLAVLFASLPTDGCGRFAPCTPALEAFGALELAVFGGITFLACLWGLAFASIGFARVHPAAAVAGLGWLAFCTLGGIPPVFQLGSLARIGPLPRVATDAPPFVHAGQGARFDVQVLHPAPERVSLPGQVDVPPGPAGPFTTVLHGSAGPLTFTTEITIPIREERGHAHFPLRTGNQWVYAPFLATGQSARVLFSGGRRSHSTDHSRTITLTVLEPSVERGVRWFPVRIQADDDEQIVRVAAVDGEVRTEDGAAFVSGGLSPDGSYQSSSACTLQPLSAYGGCRCPDRIGGIVDTPPGPSACSRKSGGGFLEGLVRGVTMIASVGILDPGSTKRVNGVELVHFERGADDAPNAPPDWRWTPEPKVIAAREALAGVAFEDDKIAAVSRAVAGTTDLSCDAAEVVLIGQPFFHQDGILVALAPHMADPLSCSALLHQVSRMGDERAELEERIRAAL